MQPKLLARTCWGTSLAHPRIKSPFGASMIHHVIYGTAVLLGKGVLAAGHALGHTVAAPNATGARGVAKLATAHCP